MKRFSIFAIALAFFFAFLTSCIVVVDYSERGTIPPKKEFHKILPFAPGGTIFLENRRGDIEIRGWDEDEVEIFAEEARGIPYSRTVRFYPIGYKESRIDLDKSDEDLIKIKTRYAGKERETVEVNYDLSVPHSVNLKDVRNRKGKIFISDVYGKAVVDLEEGDLRVENFSGSLLVSIMNGSAQAELLDLRSNDEIKITTRQGDITLFLQPEVDAQLEASTPNGNIQSDFDLNQPLPAGKVSAQIGKSGALISVSALNGNVLIKKVE